jgi:hypothetical protein
MQITIEFTEEEAAVLDRYMEAGCYDRDKLIKRHILGLIGAPTISTAGAGEPVLTLPVTGGQHPNAQFCKKDHEHPTSGYMDVKVSKKGRRADHQHPPKSSCATPDRDSGDPMARILAATAAAEKRGLPADPALFAFY